MTSPPLPPPTPRDGGEEHEEVIEEELSSPGVRRQLQLAIAEPREGEEGFVTEGSITPEEESDEEAPGDENGAQDEEAPGDEDEVQGEGAPAEEEEVRDEEAPAEEEEASTSTHTVPLPPGVKPASRRRKGRASRAPRAVSNSVPGKEDWLIMASKARYSDEHVAKAEGNYMCRGYKVLVPTIIDRICSAAPGQIGVYVRLFPGDSDSRCLTS